MVLIRKKKKKSAEELEAERHEKELRKSGIQDEFQAKGFELVDWVQHHKQYIVVGLIGFALIGVIWAGISYFGGGADLKASAAYEAALELYEKAGSATEEKAKLQAEAKKAFEKISAEHSANGVGRLADLYVGHLSLETGDPKGAMAAYDRFIKSASSKDQLRLVAMLGLANAYENGAEKKKALETYENILASGVNVDEAMVLWQAARLAKETGEEAKAKEFSAKLAERYPSSRYLNESRLRPFGARVNE